MDFSNRLKELRLGNGLTQKQLADKLNVSQNAIYNWENGKRQPDFQTLEKLAKIFDVNIDFLLGSNAGTYSRMFKYLSAINRTKSNHWALVYDILTEKYSSDEIQKIQEYADFLKSRRKDTNSI